MKSTGTRKWYLLQPFYFSSRGVYLETATVTKPDNSNRIIYAENTAVHLFDVCRLHKGDWGQGRPEDENQEGEG
jgi:hypothetical protein